VNKSVGELFGLDCETLKFFKKKKKRGVEGLICQVFPPVFLDKTHGLR